MPEKQRLLFSRGITGGSGAANDEVTVFLRARVRALIRLTGYRMILTDTPDLDAQDDTFAFHIILQTQERKWNVAIADQSLTDIVAFGGHRIIDYMGIDIIIRQVGTPGSAYVINASRQSEWVKCDLLVPQLALFAQLNATPSSNGHYGIVVEWEWEPASLATVAAAFLSWGVDPDDFDRQIL